jgi:hypothetical protein
MQVVARPYYSRSVAGYTAKIRFLLESLIWRPGLSNEINDPVFNRIRLVQNRIVFNRGPAGLAVQPALQFTLLNLNRPANYQPTSLTLVDCKTWLALFRCLFHKYAKIMVQGSK